MSPVFIYTFKTSLILKAAFLLCVQQSIATEFENYNLLNTYII